MVRALPAASPKPFCIHRVQRTLAGRDRISVGLDSAAAVLILVVGPDTPDPHVLLIRRAAGMRQHGGELGFPGGYLTDGDAGPTEAALRETSEELGLDAADIQVVGVLDDILRRTTVVTPVVGRVHSVGALAPNPDEVEAVLSVPLSALRDRSRWTIPRHVTRLGVEWPVFTFSWGDDRVWGLSAYLLLMLMQADGDAPYALPAPYTR